MGLGTAVHNGELDSDEDDRKQLGSRLLFQIPVELGFRFGDHQRISLAFDHISSENGGLDTLGIRYGYRF